MLSDGRINTDSWRPGQVYLALRQRRWQACYRATIVGRAVQLTFDLARDITCQLLAVACDLRSVFVFFNPG